MISPVVRQGRSDGGSKSTENLSAEQVALREVALVQAANLARAGRYDEAQRLLDDVFKGQVPSARHLDLVARIRAQQGRFAEAEDCWARAAALDPLAEDYSAGRRRIAAMRVRHRARWLAPVFAVVLVGLSLILVEDRATRQSSRVAASLAATRDMQDRLVLDVARLETKLESADPAPSDPLAEVAVKLALPGVRLRRSGPELHVLFESGLFAEGRELRADVQPLLTEMGLRIKPHADRLSILVVGRADDTPLIPGSRYRDNAELGLARATMVAEHLQSTAALPPDAFVVSTLGSSLPLFLNDQHQRSWNRTVEMRISPWSR